MTVGEALVNYLEARGVELIFGIPGVHTIELYRGLAQSSIRHVTARHEQGAGFMADGYARASGRVGVAFVITGPGVTNILTAMAQARADSVPMLVISGVNETASLGRGLGHLHELPDQLALCRQVARSATQITQADQLIPTLEQAFKSIADKRPGPVHIEIPIDVMKLPFKEPFDRDKLTQRTAKVHPDLQLIEQAVEQLSAAQKPLILAGGGAKNTPQALQQIAEYLAAPAILTTNARGLMHQHPLCIPASASMPAVRGLIREADCVLAVGTELGFTDYDVYRDDGLPTLKRLIRIDICPEQLQRYDAAIALQGDAGDVLGVLLKALADSDRPADTQRLQAVQLQAAIVRETALAELSAEYFGYVQLLNSIREKYPDSLIIGDSTQLIYAANLYYDHDCAGGWFNAATGYGALGYAIPAAIGAALARPGRRVICFTGDGGAQFTLTELMTAVQERLPLIFMVWNNQGYLEIANTMAAATIDVVGCDPCPPDFEYIAQACAMPYVRCTAASESVLAAMASLDARTEPVMIEVRVDV